MPTESVAQVAEMAKLLHGRRNKFKRATSYDGKKGISAEITLFSDY